MRETGAENATMENGQNVPLIRRFNTLPHTLHALLYGVLVACTVGFAFLSLSLMQTKAHIEDANDAKIRDALTTLTQGQIGFEESGKMIFPDEQKFLSTKQAYSAAKKDFIVADLKAMKLTMYDDGMASTTFDILSKGKDGSWWETPTGDYSVLAKITNGYSSIGDVWMPYSMQFYGNYLIHGWPHYSDGTPVSSSFSGGCIRLADEDAERVFNFVSVGTPILVLEDMIRIDTGVLTTTVTEAALPAIAAESFLVADLRSGEVLVEKNADTKRPIASLVKLMTAIVAHETLYLGRSLWVNTDAEEDKSEAFDPTEGERYVGLDLLYPLLMQSSNETADVLAQALGERSFLINMNNKATSLKMSETTFIDPSGIDEGNISTAHDLSKLLQYIYYKRPFIFDITKGELFDNVGSIKIGDSVSISELKNYNEFVDDSNLVGLKNGETIAAQQTLAGVWKIHTKEGEVPVAVIILGSPDRKKDAEALIGWVRTNYEVKE